MVRLGVKAAGVEVDVDVDVYELLRRVTVSRSAPNSSHVAHQRASGQAASSWQASWLDPAVSPSGRSGPRLALGQRPRPAGRTRCRCRRTQASTAASANTHRHDPGMIGRTGELPLRPARLRDSGCMPPFRELLGREREPASSCGEVDDVLGSVHAIHPERPMSRITTRLRAPARIFSGNVAADLGRVVRAP